MTRVLCLNKDGKISYKNEDENFQNFMCELCQGSQTNEEFIQKANLIICEKSIQNALQSLNSKDLYALEGVQDKVWLNNNNAIVKWDAYNEATGIQYNALAEELSCIILNHSNIEHANYQCVANMLDINGNKRPVVISKNFLSNNDSFSSFGCFLNAEEAKKYTRDSIIAGSLEESLLSISEIISSKTRVSQNDIINHFIKTIYTDMILMNPDRHLGNVGFIVHQYDPQLISKPTYDFAPIFDNGLALFACENYDVVNRDNYEMYLNTVSPTTFGSFSFDEYKDLCLSYTNKHNIVRLNISEIEKELECYSNSLYSDKLVSRIIDILLMHLYCNENELYIDDPSI